MYQAFSGGLVMQLATNSRVSGSIPGRQTAGSTG